MRWGRRRGWLFMLPRYLGVMAPRVVAAPDSAASTRRWSPSRPQQKEGEALDLWARAVSGQREARESAEAAGRAAGPVNLASAQVERRGRAAAREGKERAGARARPSGPQRERKRSRPAGERKGHGRKSGLRAKTAERERKEKEIYFFSIFPKQFKIQFQLNSKSDFKSSNTKYCATA